MRKRLWSLNYKTCILLLLFAISFFVFNAHTQSAFDSFHNFAENPDACAGCHSPHRGDRGRLIQEQNVHKVCMACHDGTRGSVVSYDEKESHFWFATREVSKPGEPGVVQIQEQDYSCNACHRPHFRGKYYDGMGDGEREKGLPKKMLLHEEFIPDGYGSYTVCLSCHQGSGEYEEWVPFDEEWEHYKKNSDWVESPDTAILEKIEIADIEKYYGRARTDSDWQPGKNGGHFLRASMEDSTYGQYWRISCDACHGYHRAAIPEKLLDLSKYLDGWGDAWVYYDSLIDNGTLSVEGEREFCGSCHNVQSTVTIFDRNLQLPLYVSKHHPSLSDEDEVACSTCHGWGENPLLAAAHAPRIPVQSLELLTYDDGGEISAEAFVRYVENVPIEAPLYLQFSIKNGNFILSDGAAVAEYSMFTEGGSAQLSFEIIDGSKDTIVTVRYHEKQKTNTILGVPLAEEQKNEEAGLPRNDSESVEEPFGEGGSEDDEGELPIMDALPPKEEFSVSDEEEEQ